MQRKKPFHESILDVIKICDEHNAYLLSVLIKETVIIGNHQAIIEAWEKRMLKLKYDNFDVPKSVHKQMIEQAKKAVTN